MTVKKRSRRTTVRRSRRFDQFKTPREITGAPWSSKKHNPFMEDWNPLSSVSHERLPQGAPSLRVPFAYFQDERTPLMSLRVNGKTVSYPVSSKDNKHSPNGLLSFAKKSKPYSETVSATVASLIDSRE